MRTEGTCVASLQRDGGLFLALFAVALTPGQPPFQLLWRPLIAVLAHRPQVNFNKLISESGQREEGGGVTRKDVRLRLAQRAEDTQRNTITGKESL